MSHYSFIAHLSTAPCNSAQSSQITEPDKKHFVSSSANLCLRERVHSNQLWTERKQTFHYGWNIINQCRLPYALSFLSLQEDCQIITGAVTCFRLKCVHVVHTGLIALHKVSIIIHHSLIETGPRTKGIQKHKDKVSEGRLQVSCGSTIRQQKQRCWEMFHFQWKETGYWSPGRQFGSSCKLC